ncbi:MAG: hypothetical protein KAI22_10940 [Gammaproteobacteria bacterium]|nr:hypothetical protein [Gammaproteobacteria bacterium]
MSTTFHIEEEINLKSWDDIINRPCYKSSIKPKKFNFTHISASYSFKDESARCGVSDCLKDHSRGFLVNTSDENETNLCENCGNRFFNVSFEQQKKILQNINTIRKQKIQLNKILEQNIIRDQVNELKQASQGANWLYHVLTSFCDTYPTELLTALKELATKTDENTALSELIENECDQSQRDNIGQLQGLNIFALDIREELIGKILKPLIELKKLADNPDEISSLTRYCKWADNLDEQFVIVEKLIKEGQLFFTTWNLEKLKSIPLPKASARLVQSVSWNINKAAKKV